MTLCSRPDSGDSAPHNNASLLLTLFRCFTLALLPCEANIARSAAASFSTKPPTDPFAACALPQAARLCREDTESVDGHPRHANYSLLHARSSCACVPLHRRCSRDSLLRKIGHCLTRQWRRRRFCPTVIRACARVEGIILPNRYPSLRKGRGHNSPAQSFSILLQCCCPCSRRGLRGASPMRTYMRLMADGPALNILPTPAARHHRPSNLNHNSQLVKIGETPSPPPPPPVSQARFFPAKTFVTLLPPVFSKKQRERDIITVKTPPQTKT